MPFTRHLTQTLHPNILEHLPHQSLYLDIHLGLRNVDQSKKGECPRDGSEMVVMVMVTIFMMSVRTLYNQSLFLCIFIFRDSIQAR